MANDWVRPTADQARLFARMLELSMPGEMGVAHLLPELDPVMYPELARRWEKDPLVRAARFDVRTWMEQTREQRMTRALEKAYDGGAIYLMTVDFVKAEAAQLAKCFKVVELLERKMAGEAGKTDAIAQFWIDMIAKKKIANQQDRVQ